jgi:acyl-CoA hydrolase
MELDALFNPGDVVLLADGAGEPTAILEALVEQRRCLPPIRLLLGMSVTDTVRAEHLDALDVNVLGGYGTNRPLVSAGAGVLPFPMSRIASLISSGALRVDVVLVQLTPPNHSGQASLGPTVGFLPAALRHARSVIAQVNEAVPWTSGDSLVSFDRLDHVVYADHPLPTILRDRPDETLQVIAGHAAALVPDGSTLQLGLGEAVDALALGLRTHHRLGLHTGIVGDALVGLMESGALTGAEKQIDRHLAVTTMLLGSEHLYRFADRNFGVSLRSSEHTHGPRPLAELENLVAVNGALEVDLTGQVNAEWVAGSYAGAVGGHSDFAHAAAVAPFGRSIVLLRSTTPSGASRIVVGLDGGVVTTPRSYVDLVVTEHGVADLRGRSLDERIERLIAIAAPQHRAVLSER